MFCILSFLFMYVFVYVFVCVYEACTVFRTWDGRQHTALSIYKVYPQAF